MTNEEAINELTDIMTSSFSRDTGIACDMAIFALREQPRWISVTERLPEIYKTVLVYRENLSVSGGYMSLEFLTTAFGYTLQWSNDLQTWKSKVTHWIPLPELPTEEDDSREETDI